MLPTTEGVLAVIRASHPDLRSSHDRAAFAIHAGFLASGYSLIATGSRALAASSGEEVDCGINGWNELHDCYAFRYFTSDKDFASVVDVRCTVMGEFLMVDVAPKDFDLVHVQIRVNEFAKENSSGNYAQQYTDLHGLVRLFSAQTLAKCLKRIPGGIREQSPKVVDTGDSGVHCPPPSYPGGRSADVRIFEPSQFGYQDLMPGVGAGIFDSGRDAGFESGEAGNLVGPNNPIWGPPGDRPRPRHDPFGPPGIPGFFPDRFGRGDRDVQHFPPP